MVQKSKADLLIQDRIVLSDNELVELCVWHLPRPVLGSSHSFKYRLAYVVENFCKVRYDNETGKGDHKHVGGVELPYVFSNLDTLQADFWADVDARRRK